MKVPKLSEHQWVSMGCPKQHKAIDIYQVPQNSKQGVRCCSMNGEKCTSSHTVPGTKVKCHLMTFREAKKLCINKGNGAFRLCSAEELNSCCGRSCAERLDGKPVWIEGFSKGL